MKERKKELASELLEVGPSHCSIGGLLSFVVHGRACTIREGD